MTPLKKELNNLLFFAIFTGTTCTSIGQDISKFLAWETKDRVVTIQESLAIKPGVIEYKDIALRTKNISDEPITINNVISDCNCLKITKNPRTLAPQDEWSFTVGLVSTRYGEDKVITILVETDKGADTLKLKFVADTFVKVSSDNLYWEKGDIKPKWIDLEMAGEDIEVSYVKVLGDGFISELVKGNSGKYSIKVTPLEDKFHKGLLKLRAANTENSKEVTIRLNRATN